MKFNYLSMRKMKKYGILFGLILLIIFSCKKKVIETDMGYDYFPTNIGHWAVYQVDSIYHDDFYFPSKYDSFQFQIKEIIESEFFDNSGRLTQRIERYQRANDTLPWVIKNVWVSNQTKTTAERVEENQRYVKLIFPPVLNQRWNGNNYNTIGEWEYKYTLVNEAYSISAFSFDSTLTVSQEGQNDPIINSQYGTEVYAKHIGMVYKEYVFLNKQSDAGLEYKMKLIDYSH